MLISGGVYLEQDIQNRNEYHKGEYIEPLRDEIQHNRPGQILSVWPEEATHYR